MEKSNSTSSFISRFRKIFALENSIVSAEFVPWPISHGHPNVHRVTAILAAMMLVSSIVMGGLTMANSFAWATEEDPAGSAAAADNPESSDSSSTSNATDTGGDTTTSSASDTGSEPASGDNSTDTSSSENSDETATYNSESGNSTSSSSEESSSSDGNSTAAGSANHTSSETGSSTADESSSDPLPQDSESSLGQDVTYSPLIWTDKDDYPPGALVTIYGSGFTENTAITMGITHPDNNIRSWGVESDALGNFETTYQLDGFAESYIVTASDGVNTATTTFTDGNLKFEETGLPSGATWSVAVPGLGGSPKSATAPNNITYGGASGTYSYSIPNVIFGGNTYVPSPSSGSASVGTGSAATTTVPVTFTLAKATPGITTEVHDSAHNGVTSVALGTLVHDKAILSGGNSPTGTVTFNLYQTIDCTGTFSTESVALSGLVAETTNLPPSLLGAGSYSYNATYNGDVNNNKVTSSCEPFTVNTAATGVTTDIHDHSDATLPHSSIAASVPVGTSVHDNATVSGQVSGFPIGGTVRYHFYDTIDCTGTFDDSGALAIGSESPAHGPLAAGSYSFNASYSGDSNYLKSVSACEPFTVEKGATSVTTEIHDDSDATVPHTIVGTSVPLGTNVHDNATVSGEVSGITLGGTITYNFYNSIDCTGTFDTSGALALGSESSSTGALAAGEYSFNATYSGDTNYEGSESACEPFTVEKATLSIVTDIHDNSDATVPHTSVGTSAPLGTAVHDNATLSGIVSGFAVTGTTNYNFYVGADDCTGTFTPETLAVGQESSATFALAAGSYSYNATYNGDSNYNKITSLCEPLTIEQATTSVTTDIHDHSDITIPHTSITTSVPLGTNVHDNATVAGEVNGFPLSGTVAYNFYSAQDCTGSFVSSSALALGSESSPSGALAAGSYSFNATYSGDSNYLKSVSACEPFTVEKEATSVTTEIHDDSDATVPHTIVGPAVIAGITVHDNATVSGQVSGFPIGGTVRYHFYDTIDCTGTFDDSGALAIGSESPAHGPLAAGSYSFNASYSGDSNYLKSISDCEPLAAFPENLLTTSGLCSFDVISTDAGRQFKLIYPPDGAGDPSKNYKLVASNPGQFYYNAFYSGSGSQTVTLTIPYPFVTQGAVPLHLYSGASYDSSGCFVPGTEIYNRAIAITIPSSAMKDNNSPTANATVTVTFDSPSDFYYLNLHLDYGLKGKSPYTKDVSNNAVNPASTSTIMIHDLGSYTFQVSGAATASDTISNKNVFKRDPGFTGIVASQTTGPLANVKVQIFDSKGALVGTAYTNSDGYYLYNYKYTGKSATFKVKLPDYPGIAIQSVTLKSNSFAVANFLLP